MDNCSPLFTMDRWTEIGINSLDYIFQKLGMTSFLESEVYTPAQIFSDQLQKQLQICQELTESPIRIQLVLGSAYSPTHEFPQFQLLACRENILKDQICDFWVPREDFMDWLKSQNPEDYIKIKSISVPPPFSY